MSTENSHDKHPIRNFFYVIFSLINLLAFCGLFYLIAFPETPMRMPLVFVAGAILLFGFVFGIVKPMATRKK